jgi:hypothetical protein
MIAETARRGHAPAASAATILRPPSFDGTLSGHAQRRPRGSRLPGALNSQPTGGSGRLAVRPENTRWTGRNMRSLTHRGLPGHGRSPSVPVPPPVAVIAADGHTIPSFTADVIAFCRDRRAARIALRRRSLRRRRRLHTPTLAIGRESLP